MSFVIYAALFLGFAASSQACSCTPQHPQEAFCNARFVIRAKVLSQEVVGYEKVIGLRILKTFKGATVLNKTDGVGFHGSNQGSPFAKVYTARDGAGCGLDWIQNNKRYVIFGRLRKGKLWVSFCDFVQEWSQVLNRHALRVGIRRFFGQNCDCQLAPCYGIDCGKLKGCASTSLSPRRNPCEWDHSYCVKNSKGTACSWYETPKYKECMASHEP